MTQLDMTFQAIADPTRRAILNQLAQGSATVNELARPFDISLPAISRHLKVMESAGLIRREVEAQHRRCHLETEALRRAAGWLAEFETFWTERFEALDLYLDETASADEQDTGRKDFPHAPANDTDGSA